MMCNRMMHHFDHNLDECRPNLPDFVYLNASAISLTVAFCLNEVRVKIEEKNPNRCIFATLPTNLKK